MITVRLLSVMGLMGAPRRRDDKPPRFEGAQKQPELRAAGTPQLEFTVDGCTVREALLNVETIVPELRGKLIWPDGTLNPALFCLVEGQPASHVDMDTVPGDGSVLLVAPVITGG